MAMIPQKRIFKAPWNEGDLSTHDATTTPSHLSQKWMDMFAFDAKSRDRDFDGQANCSIVKRAQQSVARQKSDTLGSQQQQIASRLLHSLQEKDTSSLALSQRMQGGMYTDVPADMGKRLDDLEKQLQMVLHNIKTICTFVDDFQDSGKGCILVDTIVDKVSHAILSLTSGKMDTGVAPKKHAHITGTPPHASDDLGFVGETCVAVEMQDRERHMKECRDAVLEERAKKKLRKDTSKGHVPSQESCSSYPV